MSLFRRKTLKEKYDGKLSDSIHKVQEQWKEYQRIEKIAIKEDATPMIQTKIEEKKYRLLLREIRRREL